MGLGYWCHGAQERKGGVMPTGTWKTDDAGGAVKPVLLVAAVVALAAGAGSALAAAAAAIAEMVMWLLIGAGVLALLAVVAWFATRRLRAERRDAYAAQLEQDRRRREAEIEDRHARRAAIAAAAQAQAIAPVLAAVVSAMQQPQPQQVPVRVLPAVAEEVRRDA